MAARWVDEQELEANAKRLRAGHGVERWVGHPDPPEASLGATCGRGDEKNEWRRGGGGIKNNEAPARMRRRLEVPSRIELLYTVLQTVASPLGHGTIAVCDCKVSTSFSFLQIFWQKNFKKMQNSPK